MSGYNAFAEVYDKLTDNIEYKKRADFISTLFCCLNIELPLIQPSLKWKVSRIDG